MRVYYYIKTLSLNIDGIDRTQIWFDVAVVTKKPVIITFF